LDSPVQTKIFIDSSGNRITIWGVILPINTIYGYCEECSSHTSVYVILFSENSNGGKTMFLCRDCIAAMGVPGGYEIEGIVPAMPDPVKGRT
jgi:hypothetical protein